MSDNNAMRSIVFLISSMFNDSYKESIERGILGTSEFWSPALLLIQGCEVEESKGSLHMTFNGITSNCTVMNANAFLSCFNEYLSETCDFEELLTDIMPNAFAVDYSYKQFVHQGEFTNVVGQAKLLINALDLLVYLSRKRLYILILGSSSPGVPVMCGISYDILAKFLTQLGYEGVIHMYDQYETASREHVGSFNVVRFSSNFDYSTGKYDKFGKGSEMDICICDSWVSSPITRIPDIVPIRVRYSCDPLPSIPSKYVVTYSSEECKLHILLPGQSHKELSVGEGHSINGGGTLYYSKYERAVFLYGSSNAYGPADDTAVGRCLAQNYPCITLIPAQLKHAACRQTLDPTMSFIKANRKSRISCKYFGEDLWDYSDITKYNGRIVAQHYYKGAERRLYFNVPIARDSVPYGDGCSNCIHLSKLIGSIKPINGCNVRPFLTHAVSSILGSTCASSSGQKFSKVLAMIHNMARRNFEYSAIVKQISASVDVPVDYIDRAVRYLSKLGTIKVITRRLKINISHYPINQPLYTTVNGVEVREDRYYNRAKTEFIRYDGLWCLYDESGCEIKSTVSSIRMTNQKLVTVDIYRLDNEYLLSALKGRTFSSVFIDLRFKDRFFEEPYLGGEGSLYIGSQYSPGFSTCVLINPFSSTSYAMDKEYVLDSVHGFIHIWHQRVKPSVYLPYYAPLLDPIKEFVSPLLVPGPKHVLLKWPNVLDLNYNYSGDYSIIYHKRDEVVCGHSDISQVAKTLYEALVAEGCLYIKDADLPAVVTTDAKDIAFPARGPSKRRKKKRAYTEADQARGDRSRTCVRYNGAIPTTDDY